MLQAHHPRPFIELLLAAGRALGPIIRQFFSLGLNRVWLNAGDTAYKYVTLTSYTYMTSNVCDFEYLHIYDTRQHLGSKVLWCLQYAQCVTCSIPFACRTASDAV